MSFGLTDQAQVTGQTYVQAIALNNEYWRAMTMQTDRDKVFCDSSHLCQPVYVLATRARNADAMDLVAKAKAAKDAQAAFSKIGADNAALAKSAKHLDDKVLIATLKADDPDLLTVIRSLAAHS